mmetsp:Transcript_41928/g.103235  ORF Transcript_41928/g.103235 Transcript_41928/m.103235 type:complete len:209 (+) Transcript_41928:910-1536(+)
MSSRCALNASIVAALGRSAYVISWAFHHQYPLAANFPPGTSDPAPGASAWSRSKLGASMGVYSCTRSPPALALTRECSSVQLLHGLNGSSMSCELGRSLVSTTARPALSPSLRHRPRKNRRLPVPWNFRTMVLHSSSGAVLQSVGWFTACSAACATFVHSASSDALFRQRPSVAAPSAVHAANVSTAKSAAATIARRFDFFISKKFCF